MKHEEIRFRILFTLYIKHYSNELGHPQLTTQIIKDAGLEYVEKELLYGNIVYLRDRDWVKGMDILGQAYPYTLTITSMGIDEIDKKIDEFLKFLKKESNQEYDQIEAISSFAGKLGQMWWTFNQNHNVRKMFFENREL